MAARLAPFLLIGSIACAAHEPDAVTELPDASVDPGGDARVGDADPVDPVDAGRADAGTVPPPNFVVIMADDLGAAELGVYGSTVNRTPRLDGLAAEGMRFLTAWSTPICSSTRVEIMTGQYGFRTGWYNLIDRPYAPRRRSPSFDVGAKLTFADVLGEAGYRTALTGKWQLSGRVPTLVHDAGFDEYHAWCWEHALPDGVTHDGGYEAPGKTARYWHPCILSNSEYVDTRRSDYGPDLNADFAIDFMRRHRDERFFLYYPMLLPHRPYDPTPDPDDPGATRPGSLRASIEYIDHLVGRILDELEALGLRERTLVLFTGDNGTAGAGKGHSTERGVRVPLIVSWPGVVPEGVTSRALVDLSDVLPTLADFAGATLPDGHVLDGRSLAPVLRGERDAHREWVFSYIRDERLIRDERWLQEGTGRLYDCGDSREGAASCTDVSSSTDAEVTAARDRFEALLATLPGPDVEGQQLIPPP